MIVMENTNGIYRGFLQRYWAFLDLEKKDFEENGILKKINFKQVGKKWIAKFKIHTNEVLPLEIKASYNNDERVMPLKLNNGTYPGEPDN